MYIHSYLHNNKPIDIDMKNIMESHKEKILQLLKKERIVTSSEIAKNLEISWNTAEKYLLELIIDGKINKIKKLGVNLWVMK